MRGAGAGTLQAMSDPNHFLDAAATATRRALVVGVACSVVLGVVAGVGLALTVSVLVGLAVAVVVMVAGAAGWALYVQAAVSRVVDTALAGIGSEAAPGDHESFRNALEGVAILTGVRVPNLRVLASSSANALVAHGLDDEATVVVTSGLLEDCRVVEAEVLAAELLCRVRDGYARYCTLSAGLPGVVRAAAGLDAPSVAAVVGEQRAVLEDAEAVSVTRYPPGLVIALERMQRLGTEVPGVPATGAALWIAPAVGAGSGVPEALDRSVNQDLGYRIAVLQEL